MPLQVSSDSEEVSPRLHWQPTGSYWRWWVDGGWWVMGGWYRHSSTLFSSMFLQWWVSCTRETEAQTLLSWEVCWGFPQCFLFVSLPACPAQTWNHYCGMELLRKHFFLPFSFSASLEAGVPAKETKPKWEENAIETLMVMVRITFLKAIRKTELGRLIMLKGQSSSKHQRMCGLYYSKQQLSSNFPFFHTLLFVLSYNSLLTYLMSHCWHRNHFSACWPAEGLV